MTSYQTSPGYMPDYNIIQPPIAPASFAPKSLIGVGTHNMVNVGHAGPIGPRGLIGLTGLTGPPGPVNGYNLTMGTSINDSTLAATLAGSLAAGATDGTDSALTAAGIGAFAHGTALADGLLTAQGIGSQTRGQSTDPSSSMTVGINAIGGLVAGQATDGGSLVSSGIASICNGYVDGPGSIMSTAGSGSITSGTVDGASTVTSTGAAVLVHAVVNLSADIIVASIGTYVGGFFSDSSTLTTTSVAVGSHIRGDFIGTSIINVSGNGASIVAYSDSGVLTSGNRGSSIRGSFVNDAIATATGSGSVISITSSQAETICSAAGTSVCGTIFGTGISDDGEVTMSGTGSSFHGYISGATVTASGLGSRTVGYMTLSTLTILGDGCFTTLRMDDDATAQVEGEGSFLAGMVTDTGSMSTGNGALGTTGFGYVTGTNSTMSVAADGGITSGMVIAGGTLATTGDGSRTSGYVTGPTGEINNFGDGSNMSVYCTDSTVEINATAEGGSISGRYVDGATVTITGDGGFMHANAADGNTLTVSGLGAHLTGHFDTNSTGHATGRGSFIHLDAAYATASLTGAGSFAIGANTGNIGDSGALAISGTGSSFTGWSGNGTITITGSGSNVSGYIEDATVTVTAGDGARIGGLCVNSGTMTSSGNASFVFGQALDSTEITSSTADGAITLGRNVRNGVAGCLLFGVNGVSVAAPAEVAGPFTSMVGEGSIQIAGGTDSTNLGINNAISMFLGTQILADSPDGLGLAALWGGEGADFGEMHRWDDDNENEEDRIGYFVELVTDGIQVADDNTDIIGVSSSTDTMGFVCNSVALRWHLANLTDEFGRKLIRLIYNTPVRKILIKHKVIISSMIDTVLQETGPEVRDLIVNTVLTSDDPDFDVIECKDEIQDAESVRTLVPNPDYDPSQIYISRLARYSYIPVSYLGIVRVRDDGSCVPGAYCKCMTGGVATASTGTEGWKVMSRILDTDGSKLQTSEGEDINIIFIHLWRQRF